MKFVMLPESLLQDHAIKGTPAWVLAIALFAPASTKVDRAYLCQASGFGRNAVDKALATLKTRGYARWTKKGLAGFWEFADYPAFLEAKTTPKQGSSKYPETGDVEVPAFEQKSTPKQGSLDYPEIGESSIYTNSLNKLHKLNAREESILDSGQPEQPAAEVLIDRTKQPSETDRLEDPKPSCLVGEEAKRIGDGRISPPPPSDIQARRMYYGSKVGSAYPTTPALVDMICERPDCWDEIMLRGKRINVDYQPELLDYIRRYLAGLGCNKDKSITIHDAVRWLNKRLLDVFNPRLHEVLVQVDAMREERDRRAAATYSTAAVALDPNEEYFPWNP